MLQSIVVCWSESWFCCDSSEPHYVMFRGVEVVYSCSSELYL